MRFGCRIRLSTEGCAFPAVFRGKTFMNDSSIFTVAGRCLPVLTSQGTRRHMRGVDMARDIQALFQLRLKSLEASMLSLTLKRNQNAAGG